MMADDQNKRNWRTYNTVINGNGDQGVPYGRSCQISWPPSRSKKNRSLSHVARLVQLSPVINYLIKHHGMSFSVFFLTNVQPANFSCNLQNNYTQLPSLSHACLFSFWQMYNMRTFFASCKTIKPNNHPCHMPDFTFTLPAKKTNKNVYDREEVMVPTLNF